ncbi:5'-methylthioadenosine/S-adenosylhomocysteine nucleosidase [compost metagenome]
MESVSVAHTCYSYRTPFVIIKAISDFADKSLEELKMKNVVKATICVTTLVMQMLNNAPAE